MEGESHQKEGAVPTAIIKSCRRGQTFLDGWISHCSASLSSMKPAASRRRLHSSTTDKEKEKVRLLPSSDD